MHKILLRILLFTVLISLLTACASNRKPVPAGEVPQQHEVSAADEEYGHQVLNELTERYPLDRNRENIKRVRQLVDTLTQASKAGHNPWHAYVLVDDNFKNAAATRGNHIFVWTGMLKSVQNDEELATVLAHEISHVLAGHTDPDPQVEVGRMLSGVAGDVAQQVLIYQGGQAAAFAALAGMLVASTIQAMAVNPYTQESELEADMIGLFIMADAGFNPENAVNFWERVAHDPSFNSGLLQFMSSHPSSEARIANLRSHLPEAMLRYKKGGRSAFVLNNTELKQTKSVSNPPKVQKKNPPKKKTTAVRKKKKSPDPSRESWKVEDFSVPVYRDASTASPVVHHLNKGSSVTALKLRHRWLEIDHPVRGFVQSWKLTPKK